MIKKENRASAVQLHQSLKELSGGVSIKTDFISPAMKEIIKASAAQSAELIESIPQQYMVGFQGEVMRSNVLAIRVVNNYCDYCGTRFGLGIIYSGQSSKVNPKKYQNQNP